MKWGLAEIRWILECDFYACVRVRAFISVCMRVLYCVVRVCMCERQRVYFFVRVCVLRVCTT